MTRPRAGKDYPGSLGEFQAWFSTEGDCLDYLEWLRWPDGFLCPECRHEGGWRLEDGRFMCPGCGHRTSVTAGTLFHRTQTPMTAWFRACWMFATGEEAPTALRLKRDLGIGSYQTAWTMLHRLRSALVRPGRDRLSGAVEVGRICIEVREAGPRGGQTRGTEVLTGIAVEVGGAKERGRCRLAPLADCSASALRAFVSDHVEPGATLVTEGWPLSTSNRAGPLHGPPGPGGATAPGAESGGRLPAVHRVAMAARQWLQGAQRGSIAKAHLPAYLNEFVFRFNHRPSLNRGNLFFRALKSAIGHPPVRYRDIAGGRRPRAIPPTPPPTRRSPPTPDGPKSLRPWRTRSDQVDGPDAV